MIVESSDAPLVSVVVPTYYRNGYLERCLRSVAAQTYPAIETIVVDDSGERHAADVARRFDVEYVGFDENRGQNVARNCGFEAAAGRYVQFLDDDDRLHPRKIEAQVDYLERTPDVGVVYCGRLLASGHIEEPEPSVAGDVLAEMLTFDNEPCLTSTLLIDADPLAEIHPFPTYHAAADVPIKIELARRVRFGYVDEVLVSAGEPAHPMGQSVENVESKWRILDDYAELYDAQPDRVLNEAIAATLRGAGRRSLDGSVWSPAAIAAFLNALRHDPSPDISDVGEFLVSIGGRPTYRLAAGFLTRVRRPDAPSSGGLSAIWVD